MPSTGRKTRRVYVVGNSLPKMSCKPLPLGKFARLEYKQEVGAGMRSRTHLSGSKHSLASLGRHSPRILTQMSTPPHSPPISKRTCTRSHTRTTSPKAAPAFSPLPADTCGSTSGMVTKPAAATTPAERLRKVVVKVKAVVRFKGLDLDNREQQELAKIQAMDRMGMSLVRKDINLSIVLLFFPGDWRSIIENAKHELGN